jgi:hypothetical protein
LLKLSSLKQGRQIVSPRLPQMASQPRQPACRFDAAVAKKDGGFTGNVRGPLRHVAHSMDPDAFSPKTFSTFRAHRHRCISMLR